MLYSFRKVASAIRVVAGRKSVETCLPQKIVEMNHKLDPYFVSKELNMKFKPKTKSDDVSDIDDQGMKNVPTIGVTDKNIILISNFDIII